MAAKKINMKNFKILDCTLRDGGYYTNWDFKPQLVDKYLKSGFYNYTWEPINISSGTYFIQLSGGKNLQTNKILFYGKKFKCC